MQAESGEWAGADFMARSNLWMFNGVDLLGMNSDWLECIIGAEEGGQGLTKFCSEYCRPC